MSDRVVRSRREQQQEVIERCIKRRAAKTDLLDAIVWGLGFVSYFVVGLGLVNIAWSYYWIDAYVDLGEPFDAFLRWMFPVCVFFIIPICLIYVFGHSPEDSAVRSLYRTQLLLGKPGIMRKVIKQRRMNNRLKSVARQLLRIPLYKLNRSVAVVSAAQLKANYVRSIMDDLALAAPNSRLDIRDKINDVLLKIAKGRWQDIKDGDPDYTRPPSRWKKIVLVLVALALLCSIGVVALYLPQAAGLVGVIAIPFVLLIAKRLGLDADLVGSGIKLGREGPASAGTNEEEA